MANKLALVKIYTQKPKPKHKPTTDRPWFTLKTAHVCLQFCASLVHNTAQNNSDNLSFLSIPQHSVLLEIKLMY